MEAGLKNKFFNANLKGHNLSPCASEAGLKKYFCNTNMKRAQFFPLWPPTFSAHGNSIHYSVNHINCVH